LKTKVPETALSKALEIPDGKIGRRGMKKILFQGDSITDCGRKRENNTHLGMGYALLVKAQLGFDSPGQYEFYNRGISGNRIVDLYARIKADIINLAPDYISILIGVNDVLHEFGGHNGVDADKFEKIYSMLIEEIKQALPDVKIIIMEPFCLKGLYTDNTENEPNKWDELSAEVRERAKRAKNVAEKYNLTFVEIQEVLDKATMIMNDAYWLADGVHPKEMGHELLKREWIKAFEKIVEMR